MRFTVWRLMATVAVAAFVFARLARAARPGPPDRILSLLGGAAVAMSAAVAPYRIALPVIWLVAALSSWDHPGDEYGLFALSCAPAAWVAPFLAYTHLREVLPILLAAGMATMALVGWLMDGLRVRRAAWLPLFALGAVALVLYALSEYPSYQRAMAKNGSLMAYASAATNVSLYLSSILVILGTLSGRAIATRRR
jgi:hypothetical protein